MQPSLGKPFSSPDWIFEPKWDGYRALCFYRKVPKLISRRQNDLTKRFPEIQFTLKHECLIDGEIVALDSNGLPCFHDLKAKKTRQVVYYAFDLLNLDGRDLTQVPLIKRKAMLKRLLPKNQTGRIRYTDHVVGKGEKLFAELEKQCLEGMVAKRAGSVYVPGRTREWLKIKTSHGREEIRRRI